MHSRLPLAGAAAATLLQLAACQTSKPTTATTTPASLALGTPVAAGPAIETLGTYPVSAREFAYVYKKNNSTAPDYGTRASVTDYLTLYTNFRLKVLDAEKHGLDTTQAFRRELDGYKQQLALPYLTEKGVTDQLVREAYDRMGQEVNASHILVRVAPDAAPADTLAAYQKVVALRQRVTGGEDFGTVARATSEDPSARENAGKLGYFTAMQMVYPFETAAYRTPVGQVSQPIRTRFGYHIIKVNDRRAAQGEIKVAHLMVRVTPQAPRADSVAAHKKIDELYARLRKGENWNKLVAQFSEDAGSAPNGGELPPFGTGRMIPSFEEVAFKLQKPGDISAPVQTPYGWHIIKLIEKQPLPPFATMEPTLKSKVGKDSRSELNRAAFLKRIRQEDQFVEIPAAKQLAFAQADSALVKGHYKFGGAATMRTTGTKTGGPKTLKAGGDKLPLFTISGKPYSVADFLAFVQQNQRPRPTATPQFAMQQLYDQYVDQSLTDFEKASLPTKYEDYRMLVQEYRDGILLFQLMDEKVWSKAIEDTAGLRKFFMANQANYQFGQRARGTVISAASPQLLARAQRELRASRYPVAGKAGTALVHFKPGTASPANSGGSAVLDDVARRLSQDTALTVTVAGHIRKGESAALARQRTTAAIDYLAKTGKIERRRLSAGPASAAVTATGDTRIAFFSNSTSALEASLNQQNPLAVQIQQRTFQKGDNKVMDDYLTRPAGTYQVQRDGRYYAILVKQTLAPGAKALRDARGQATSDYQNYLEKQWIAQLRQQYPVKVNEDEVSKLVTK
ncbi:peptidylprolyl isomerase [Hymenobacter sp. BRD128]|uniref:peptidylprolyl isomerase n=1 Tax=Hymenobacter sp. BRD128 TaxID=2675878 RepID=UPI00156652D8|nr:peptidylprolyl isomerase [Hymenobacter sp. BRD128]QKG57675.1 peptidylprolyl isomerase [Hymenobacter sp. BRD128]